MSNYTAIRELLSRISGQDNTFTVPRIFVEYTGDLTTAVLLNQIVFYSDKSKRTDGYFYKTYKEWEENVCLTERQVRYSINKLKEKGVVETKLMKANGSPTVHYKLLFDKFVESILTFCQNRTEQIVSIQSDNLSETLTEITTETTTEKKIKKTKTKTKPLKKEYAEFVKMTDSEFSKLVEKYGESLTNKMIETLDNYKGANDKTYESDYRAILYWVAGKVIKEYGGTGQSIPKQPQKYEQGALTGLWGEDD